MWCVFLAAVKKKSCKIVYFFYHLICSSSFVNFHVELCTSANICKSNANRAAQQLKICFFSWAVLSFSSANLCRSFVEQICFLCCALQAITPVPGPAGLQGSLVHWPRAGALSWNSLRYQLHLLKPRCGRNPPVTGTAVHQTLKTEIFNPKMNSLTFSLLFLNSMG